jgi:hypothetical protein
LRLHIRAACSVGSMNNSRLTEQKSKLTDPRNGVVTVEQDIAYQMFTMTCYSTLNINTYMDTPPYLSSISARRAEHCRPWALLHFVIVAESYDAHAALAECVVCQGRKNDHADVELPEHIGTVTHHSTCFATYSWCRKGGNEARIAGGAHTSVGQDAAAQRIHSATS